MANEFYISAGLPPNDSGETTAANTFYISAGLVPDDAGPSASLTQYAFRFRNDDGSESAATWDAAENTNVSLSPGSKIRLRVGIDATGNPESKDFQLEYRRKPSGGSFGDWGKVT